MPGAEGQAAMWWGLGPAQGGRQRGAGAAASQSLLRLFFPLPVLSPRLSPLPGLSGEDVGGRPGLLSVLSWRAPRASLTCKLASSDWLWQQWAATLPAPCECVCVRVRVRVRVCVCM